MRIDSTPAAITRFLYMVCKADWEGALDQDEYIEILRETGLLPTGRFGVLNFFDLAALDSL